MTVCDRDCFNCPYEDCIAGRPAYSEKKRIYQREWRAAHPEKMREYARKYYKAHTAQRAAYYLKNRERIIAYNRAYREKNREQIAKARRERYQRKKAEGREDGEKRLEKGLYFRAAGVGECPCN